MTSNVEREMSDEELCVRVAEVWVDGGGDAEGLDWCYQKLKAAVQAEIVRREAVRRNVRRHNGYRGEKYGQHLGN